MIRTDSTVLIADDDEFFRLAIHKLLSSNLNFGNVVEVSSLDDAICLLSENSRISMALFDLDMPGMNGAASLKAVRECFPELHMVVVSASQKRQDILMALDAGVNGYVPKGVGAGELSRALGLIIGGSIYVPASISRLRTLEDIDARNISAQLRPQICSAGALTPRQNDVLELLVKGTSNKEIARNLSLGEGTVKIHVAALFRALGVNTRTAAAAAGAELLSTRH